MEVSGRTAKQMAESYECGSHGRKITRKASPTHLDRILRTCRDDSKGESYGLIPQCPFFLTSSMQEKAEMEAGMVAGPEVVRRWRRCATVVGAGPTGYVYEVHLLTRTFLAVRTHSRLICSHHSVWIGCYLTDLDRMVPGSMQNFLLSLAALAGAGRYIW